MHSKFLPSNFRIHFLLLLLPSDGSYIIFIVRSICSPIIKLAPISITALRATLTGSSAKLRKCKQLSMSAALQVTCMHGLHSRTRSMYMYVNLKDVIYLLFAVGTHGVQRATRYCMSVKDVTVSGDLFKGSRYSYSFTFYTNCVPRASMHDFNFSSLCTMNSTHLLQYR